jgi:hypothetical protein
VEEAEVVAGKFIEAREAATVVLELVEKALDEVTLFIKFSVVLRWFFAVFLGRDNRFCTQLGDGVADVLGVIGFVSHDELSLKVFE